ncbi:SSS family transporter [Saccharopolyspora erythraea NRRL 2338]|uniref:Transporter, solute:sodium symporter (SSS) family protein n=2 Tax=Saccharopolyspora erythraea TaxID=1836 RepID=A4FMG6_SACEN|nr:sodium:solute symporter [Saccharopolyspora erythraea]EQD81589.1 sodium:solute symporter [Saccharopolyspora erythraea D]PFG98889.1 SSS family transporter [Saccharopolyspora erythraea NRRL 2338]QRK88878.1 sodium:solute symporter [Saccharopolyspora erythraea]CAM05241.1 transporter, solute:sodium symporter (SSS) family protein [Saccharopolyspora erythraea NRRL 2338]
MHPVDVTIIVGYLVLVPIIGVLLAGKQRTSKDFFVSDRNMPSWAVCFAIVATETSTLTVISTPTVAYLGSFTFLQIAIGYLLGRIVVAFVLLPRYYEGELVTAYAYLGKRFGPGVQGTASATFLVTRLLADGVRLFATAIPVKVMLSAAGFDVAFWQIILVITIITVLYTYLGGTRAVVWVDAFQMVLYVVGGLVAVYLLAGRLPGDWFETALDEGKFQLFDFSGSVLTEPYAFITAVVGGAMLSMASHGADQLIVQRLLATRTLRASRTALIGSGVLVFFQFGLFLLIGTMLWSFYNGVAPKDMGMATNDDLFPTFIVTEMPPGIAGLLIAGILAAAMSSSLNSLATSTVTDIYQRLSTRVLDDAAVLRQAKVWVLIWGVALFAFASMFTDTENPVIELGLSVTGYTYGALLGAFFLGLLVKRARQSDGVIAFVVTVAVMGVVILGVTFPDGEGGQASLAFPWYTPVGVVVTLLVGGLLSLRHRRPVAPPEPVVEQEPA